LDKGPPSYLDLQTTSSDGLCFDQVLVDGIRVGHGSAQWMDKPCEGDYSNIPCAVSLNWIIRPPVATAQAVAAEIPSPPITHPDPLHSVIFRSFFNKFMVAEANGQLNANRPWIGAWEIFVVIDNSDGTTSFMSHHNNFLSAKQDGALFADAVSIGDSEKFTLLYNSDGTVSFQSHYGK